ncbi:MAG: DnaD domain protein [Dehalococcoidia bacterium]|nr:DnaD domain protein [Dehalococcoidia bacterium]
MGSRTWVKVYCKAWLTKSISQESLELRGAWITLLCVAGNGQYGDDGVIKLVDGVGVPDIGLAKLLHISARQWAKLKSKLVSDERIRVDGNNIITILNWSKYQGEYQRQKPYREREKLQPKVTSESYKAELPTENRDKRIEIENRDRDTPLNPPTGSLFDPLTEKALKDYEDAIVLPGTLLSAEMKAELLQACQTFSPAFVSDAIKEAVAQNQRTWRYIRGILNNWQRKEDTETQ